MKKLLSFLLTILLLTASAGAVDLYVDNDLIDTDTPPTIVNGRTLVPVRAIFEAIGATVEWDNNTRTATGVRDGVIVSVQIDNATAYVNGEARTLDVPAQIINGRTMVPARFISEAMGCDVTWDQATQTVGVAYELRGKGLYATPTGKKYHYDGSCNGGNYYAATLAEIRGRGLEPCEKCVKTTGLSTSAPTTPTISQPSAATASQKAALAQAKRYLDIKSFSYEGLIGQLEYEKYTREDAVYAVDNCGADWNEQALRSAKSYLGLTAFSYEGLIGQLEYEKYTSEQAAYAADYCGADWNEQAVRKAESYLSIMSFSRDRLIDQLEYDGFTHAQAVYGAEQNGY